jgi:WD40-like Beta Propeller Repeat
MRARKAHVLVAMAAFGLGVACTSDFAAPFAGTSTLASGDASDFPDTASEPDTSVEPDATVDAGGRCDPTKPFGPLVRLGISVNDADASGRLSADELTIYFTSDRNTTPKRFRGWTASRTSKDLPFAAPVLVAEEAAGSLYDPTVPVDGLTIYFQLTDTTTNQSQIRTGKRTDLKKAFGTFTTVSGLDVAADDERDPYLMKDGSLLFTRQPKDATSASDLFVAPPGTPRVPAAITLLNTTNGERDPVLSEDGLEIFYASDRSRKGTFRISHATRKNKADPWGPASAITELSDQLNVYDAPTWISVDRCVLYIASDRDTDTRLYLATRGH